MSAFPEGNKISCGGKSEAKIERFSEELALIHRLWSGKREVRNLNFWGGAVVGLPLTCKDILSYSLSYSFGQQSSQCH